MYYSVRRMEVVSVEQITRTPKQLGSALRRQRKKLGVSQETLAARIHLRQATISALENSASDTKLGTLYDALAALETGPRP